MQFTISSGRFAKHAGVVSDDHFGAVYSTYYGLHAFDKQRAELGVTDVRWPGGTRGENARDFKDVDGDGDRTEYLFSLDNPNMIEIGGKGLSDMLEYTREHGADLTIFVPSVRYLGDPSSAYADTMGFAKRLLTEEFGKLPQDLTIEIGNETLDGTIGRAKEYGKIANAQIAALRKAIEQSANDDADIDIAVQIGRSGAEDWAIRSQISKANLAEIDGLIAHHLPINIANHNRTRDADSWIDQGDNRFTRNVDYVKNWEKAVADAAGFAEIDLDFLVTAWTVGSSSEIADRNLAWNDIGARQARTTIDTFANLLDAGADAMSLWGVDGRVNPNFYSRIDGNEVELSHGGVAFQMMASSLKGKILHDGFVQDWAVTGERESDANVYVFEDASQYVIFVAANDIDRPTRVTLSVEDMDNTRAVQVMSLTTEIDNEAPAYLPRDGVREWERPVTSMSQFLSKADEFDFFLQDAHDVHRLVIWKDEEDARINSAIAQKASGVLHMTDAPGRSVMSFDDDFGGVSEFHDDFSY